MANEILIYTAIFGNAKLKDAPKVNGFKFVCFSEKERDAVGWEYRIVEEDVSTEMKCRFANRKYKINPHIYFPEETRSVYWDGNFKVFNNEIFNLILIKITANELTLFANSPDKTFNEKFREIADGCLIEGAPEILTNQLNEYKEIYDLRDIPNLENCLLIRQHTERVIDLMNSWWTEFQIYPFKDEASLPIVLIRQNPKVQHIIYSIEEWNSFASLLR